MTLTVSVLVPTWKRPVKLRWCLQSLCLQRHRPDQVVVVHRPIDTETLPVLEEFRQKLPLTLVSTDLPGVIAAENLAMQAATGDIVCFLDDDAEAPEHWLAHILAQFEHRPTLAGIGGPDLITGMPDGHRYMVKRVGELTWYGRVIGNHHLQVEQLMPVMMLKGVNMSFRRQHLRPLDEVLSCDHAKGNGAFWEMDLCLSISLKGGELVFDPAIDVKHHSDHAHFLKWENLRNSSHNMIYVLLKHLPWWRQMVLMCYGLIIGNRQLRGLLWTFVQLFLSGPEVLREAWYSWRGMLAGVASYCKKRGPAKQTLPKAE